MNLKGFFDDDADDDGDDGPVSPLESFFHLKKYERDPKMKNDLVLEAKQKRKSWNQFSGMSGIPRTLFGKIGNNRL